MKIPATVIRWWERWTKVGRTPDNSRKLNINAKSPLLYCAPICLAMAFFGVTFDYTILWAICFALLVAFFFFRSAAITRKSTAVNLFFIVSLILIVLRLLLLEHIRAADAIAGYPDDKDAIYTVYAILDQDVQKSGRASGDGERHFAKATLKKVTAPNGFSQEINSTSMIFSGHELNHFNRGDFITFKARLKELDKQQRTRYFVTVRSGISLLRAAHDNYGTESLRKRLREELTKGLSPDVASLTVGMVTGDRTLFSEDLNENMKHSGLTHLTAVSGSNCAIVIGFVVLVLRCIRTSKTMVSFISIITLCYFVILVRPDASVLRASAMAIIAVLSLNFGRDKQPLHLLAVVVMGLLVWDPYLSRDYSFLLSVSATLSIILWAQKLTKTFSRYLPSAFAALIAVPASAHVLCTPIIIFIQPEVTPYAIIANILAAPVVAPVTVIGMLALGISLFSVESAQCCIWYASYGVSWIVKIADFFARLPASVIPWPQGIVGFLQLLAINCILLYGLLFLLAPRQEYRAILGSMSGFISILIFRSILLLRCYRDRYVIHCAVYALVTMYVCFFTTPSPKKPPWNIAMCDVGQGDAFIVQNARKEAFLIDLGNDAQKLKKCISKTEAAISAIFITHFHEDHYAALKTAYRNGMTVYASAATSGIPPADKKIFAHIPITYIDSSFSLEFGDIKVQTLWPRPDYRVDAAHENNASLVLSLEFIIGAETSYHAVFAGDIEEEATSAMIRTQRMPERIDVLKIAHHGAKNGGTQLLENYRPIVALASMGRNNRYRHPHRDIVAAIERQKTLFGRTDTAGTVLVGLTSSGIKLYADTT